MRSYTFLSILAVLLSAQLVAQTPHPCGTTEGRSKWLIDYQNGMYPVNRSADEWLIVPMYVHITGEDDGSDYTSSVLVGESMKILNEAFVQSKIQFFLVADYNFIDNSEYHNHSSFGSGRAMMNQHKLPGGLNVFICADAAGNCGYYSGGPDAVVVNNDCLDPVNQTWAHEMGHMLSLPHPFLGWEGTDYEDDAPTPNNIGGRSVEKIDGSNCDFAGDGFCGTPPDYLSYRWSCNSDGESNLTLYDPEGIPFHAQGDIIMSYSTGACRTKFSDDQTDAMAANITNFRSALLDHDREYKPVTDCEKVSLISPAQMSTIIIYACRGI